VVFTSDRRRNKEVNTPIGKPNVALRERCRAVATKRKFSNTETLSVFKSVFAPIFTCRRILRIVGPYLAKLVLFETGLKMRKIREINFIKKISPIGLSTSPLQ